MCQRAVVWCKTVHIDYELVFELICRKADTVKTVTCLSEAKIIIGLTRVVPRNISLSSLIIYKTKVFFIFKIT
jgi:hypothetical protein